MRNTIYWLFAVFAEAGFGCWVPLLATADINRILSKIIAVSLKLIQLPVSSGLEVSEPFQSGQILVVM